MHLQNFKLTPLRGKLFLLRLRSKKLNFQNDPDDFFKSTKRAKIFIFNIDDFWPFLKNNHKTSVNHNIKKLNFQNEDDPDAMDPMDFLASNDVDIIEEEEEDAQAEEQVDIKTEPLEESEFVNCQQETEQQSSEVAAAPTAPTTTTNNITLIKEEPIDTQIVPQITIGMYQKLKVKFNLFF
jgi:hypothetical protein